MVWFFPYFLLAFLKVSEIVHCLTAEDFRNWFSFTFFEILIVTIICLLIISFRSPELLSRNKICA